MGAGAKSESIRLITAAIEVIESLKSSTDEADDAATRVDRLLDHGISRRVDHRLRQHKLDNNPWAEFEVGTAETTAAARPGMLVLLGSHPNGHVRQEAVRLGAAVVAAAADSGTDVKVLPGLARMLAQRSLDAIAPVREPAIQAVATLFATEMASDNDGRMPTSVERAGRELLATTRCVVECPALVESALDLFAARVGRYSNNGVRDHHRHNLKEVDRRAQVLAELQRLRETLTDGPQAQAADRLIAFYDASMRPTTAPT